MNLYNAKSTIRDLIETYMEDYKKVIEELGKAHRTLFIDQEPYVKRKQQLEAIIQCLVIAKENITAAELIEEQRHGSV